MVHLASVKAGRVCRSFVSWNFTLIPNQCNPNKSRLFQPNPIVTNYRSKLKIKTDWKIINAFNTWICQKHKKKLCSENICNWESTNKNPKLKQKKSSQYFVTAKSSWHILLICTPRLLIMKKKEILNEICIFKMKEIYKISL